MNSNKEFLNWIYERMVCVHGERDMFDYMINFKSIIDSLPNSERAQQELQAYRDIIKELLPLAEHEIKMSTCIGYSYDKWKSTISKARKLNRHCNPYLDENRSKER